MSLTSIPSPADIVKSVRELENNCVTKTSVLNATSTSDVLPYSASFIENKFVTKAFVTPTYYTKTSDNTASLELDKPSVSATNYLQNSTTNIDFPTNPDLIITRTVSSPITYTNSNQIIVNATVSFSRNCTISFAMQVFGKPSSSSEYVALSSKNASGWKTFVGNASHSEIIDLPQVGIYLDNIVGAYDIEIGGEIQIRFWIKEQTSTQLITRTYCGVTVDGYDRNSVAVMSASSVSINTSQIQNGAITYEKLDANLQTAITNGGGSSEITLSDIAAALELTTTQLSQLAELAKLLTVSGNTVDVNANVTANTMGVD